MMGRGIPGPGFAVTRMTEFETRPKREDDTARTSSSTMEFVITGIPLMSSVDSSGSSFEDPNDRKGIK